MRAEKVPAQPLDLHRFTRHARAGSLMTLIGGIIIMASLVYSGSRLAALERKVKDQQQKLSEEKNELERLHRQKNATQFQLDDLGQRLNRARASFHLAQHGVKKFYTGNYRVAIQYYDQAIAIDPTSPVLYDLKGYALLKLGELEESVRSLETAVRLDPQYTWGHYNLSLACWATGRREEAMQQIRQVVAIDPSFRDVIRGDKQFAPFSTVPEFKSLIGGGT